LEYPVLKPFQHIHGYKRPGDMAELSEEEAKKKIASGHVGALADGWKVNPEPGFIIGVDLGTEIIPETKGPKKRRKSSEGGAGES
jgi:hypothetical protein